jgi:hypothetical protein
MKGKYPVSRKAGSPVAYQKHLRPYGKRRVNKSTRKILKQETLAEVGE